MKKRVYILPILLLFSLLCQAQTSTPTQAFYLEIDARPYDGDYTGYAVLLHTDSTIEIRIYGQKGMAYQPPFYKTAYFGKYSMRNDSCYISYLTGYTERKDKYRKQTIKYNIPTDAVFLKLNAVFYIRNGSIYSPGFLFPPLPKAPIIKVKILETIFQQWNKTVTGRTPELFR